jgi:hypothetical protein
LWQAYCDGELSLRSAEAISRKLGSHSAQDRWLQKESERRTRKAQGEHIAATVITSLLSADSLDLFAIGAAIREAITHSGA